LAVALSALCAVAGPATQDGVLALLDTLDAVSVTNTAPLAVSVPTNSAAAMSVQVTNVVQLVVTNSVWATLDEKRMISTRTFRLHYADAQEVAEKFNSTWSGDFGIAVKIAKIAQAFPEANTVMVTAPGAILDACEKVVKDIDVEAPQVYIEARFVELQNSASHKLGIDWSMLDGMKGTATFGGGMDRIVVGNAVTDFKRTVTSSAGNSVGNYSYGIAGQTTSKTSSSSENTAADGAVTSSRTSSETSVNSGRNGGINFFAGTLQFSDMSLVLSALDSSGDARIFSNPKIIVSNGKKAMVDMTEKYPNVQISAKRTTSGSSDSLDLSMNMASIPGEEKLMFAKEAFFSWGISLEVTPRVSSNGLINVSIVPTISSRSDWVTASAGDTTTTENSAGTYSSKYPVLDVQRLVTDFTLAAGETAVIGGLSRTNEEQVDTGIPWLRDLPWIGDKLFGRKTRMKVQKEIIVFVTVGMADPKNLKQDAGMPKNAVLGRMYTEGIKFEPGDRTGNAIEGISSLDTRSLDEQAKDPLATNKTEHVSFPMPFSKSSDAK
jgi:type II secretory pathway component GspD/PulD (secretin)